MAVPIDLPRIGWALEPLTVVEWKAKESSRVEKGDVILVVMTEKITYDIEAGASGYLHIVLGEGENAPIGTIVGLIAETKEELEKLQKEQPKEMVAAAESKTAPPAEAALSTVSGAKEGRIRISPVARKIAEENMIDIASIVGTGPEGRIVREDIERAIGEKKKKPTVTVAQGVYQGKKVKSVMPLKGMRQAIAERMHRSLSVSAQLTAMGEIEMTEVIKLREALLGQAELISAKITYTDIFVLAVARALKKHNIINSSLIDNEIRLWEDINIGVAVALEDGLIVPVVKEADKKSLVEVNQTLRTLVEKAREGKLVPEEVTGGTFTITNLGALGGGYRFETVIINQPESAILGTGGIADRVVVRGGQIVIRPIMTYYFTYDHRVISGAEAARFMADVTKLLETTGLLLA